MITSLRNKVNQVRALFVRTQPAPVELLTLSYDKVSWGMYQTRNEA